MLDKKERLIGTLLGTAIGDAFGLPFEGLPSGVVKKKLKSGDRFYFLGNHGIVSDDTELSALLAQSLLKASGDVGKLKKYFKIALLGWFLRLPWGIGLGTLKSCLKIVLGFKSTGSKAGSAGNGAAMRSAILGVFLNQDDTNRLLCGKQIAEITHLDQRAVEGALFVSEVASILSKSENLNDFSEVINAARKVISNDILNEAINKAIELADKEFSLEEAVKILSNTGYVVHTVSLVTFSFLSYEKEPLDAIVKIILAGGDTDTNAAILGAWCGSYYGIDWIPNNMLNRIQSGPFGRKHLEKLGEELSKEKEEVVVPKFSCSYSLLRNLAMYPVILIMGVGHIYYSLFYRD